METLMIRFMKGDPRALAVLGFFSFVTLVLLAGAVLLATGAIAASPRVKIACANDYFAHCSKFSPNSQATRDCMNDVGDKLSKRCVNALVADGEVSDQEIAQRSPAKHNDDE
jgi:hypothetical protein